MRNATPASDSGREEDWNAPIWDRWWQPWSTIYIQIFSIQYLGKPSFKNKNANSGEVKMRELDNSGKNVNLRWCDTSLVC